MPDDQTKREILACHEAGETYSMIALRFGISERTVGRVLSAAGATRQPRRETDTAIKVRISRDLDAAIEARASRSGTTKSAVVRWALGLALYGKEGRSDD